MAASRYNARQKDGLAKLPWAGPVERGTLGRSAHRCENDVVEAGDGVGLGPQARAAFAEGRVRRLDDELAVHIAPQRGPDDLTAQLLPHAGCDADRATLDLAALSIHVLEDDDVSLERIAANDVVVRRVLDPQQHA